MRSLKTLYYRSHTTKSCMERAHSWRQWLETNGKSEPILEVETDKINMKVEALVSGTLFGIRIAAGESVPIGTVIAQILLLDEVIPMIKPIKRLGD